MRIGGALFVLGRTCAPVAGFGLHQKYDCKHHYQPKIERAAAFNLFIVLILFCASVPDFGLH